MKRKAEQVSKEINSLVCKCDGALGRLLLCDGEASQALVHDNAWQALDQRDEV